MNIKEFAALKVGDTIENPFAHSQGEVVSTDASGVRVQWTNAGKVTDPQVPLVHTPTWHYGVNSTAWMHWSKAEHETDTDTTAPASAPTT